MHINEPANKDKDVLEIDQKTQKAIEGSILNSDMCDVLYRHYLRTCGYKRHYNDDNAHKYKQGQIIILMAMIMFLNNETTKDFSRRHEMHEIKDKEGQNNQEEKPMLTKLIQASHPYFI